MPRSVAAWPEGGEGSSGFRMRSLRCQHSCLRSHGPWASAGSKPGFSRFRLSPPGERTRPATGRFQLPDASLQIVAPGEGTRPTRRHWERYWKLGTGDWGLPKKRRPGEETPGRWLGDRLSADGCLVGRSLKRVSAQRRAAWLAASSAFFRRSWETRFGSPAGVLPSAIRAVLAAVMRAEAVMEPLPMPGVGIVAPGW